MAITDYYVTVAGGPTKTGTQEDPFSWDELNTRMSEGGTAAPGDRYNIQEGTYTLTATGTWTIDGSAASPIIIRGCKTDWTPIEPVRSAYNGALVTTHYPVINYAATKNMQASLSDLCIYKCLAINAAMSGGSYGSSLRVGAGCIVYGCVVSNSGNSATGHAIDAGGHSLVFNCDCSATGTTAGAAGIKLNAANARAIMCKVTASPSYGIICGATNQVLDCEIMGHSDYGVYFSGTTGSLITVLNTTIYGGKGVGFADVAHPWLSVIIANHITDGGAYAFENLEATGCPVVLANNRTRDNTSGAISWNGDWATATTWNHVTTDTGDASTDFVDAGAGNLNLISSAPGKGAGIMGADIGALQRPEPTYPVAGNTRSGSGTYGDVFSPTTPTMTLPLESNVWRDTEQYGADGTEFTPSKRASSITNCTPENIREFTTIDNVTGTYSQSVQIAEDQAAVLAQADHIWHGTTILGQTGTMVGSDIPNCEPSNIKDGISIDDVTGTQKTYLVLTT